jgi:hypothetical protein
MAWWAGGGVGMYVVLAVCVLVGGASGLAVILSIVAWFFRPLRLVAKILGILVVLGCITPLIVGFAAGSYGRYRVDTILEMPDIEPEQREAIRRAGYAEAQAPAMFGGASTCLLLIPASLAALIALAIPKPQQDESD